MGLFPDEWVAKAQEAVSNVQTQIEQVGIPMLQASAERWAADVLNKQANETQAVLNRNVAALPEPAPGTFMSSMTGVVKSSAASQYAIPLVAGVVILAVVVLASKK